MPLAARRQQGIVVTILLVLWNAKGEEDAIHRLAMAVAEYNEYLPLSDSSYLIKTDRGSGEVFDALKQKIGRDENESLMVLTVPAPYMGRAPARVKLWLLQQSKKDSETDEQGLGTFLAD